MPGELVIVSLRPDTLAHILAKKNKGETIDVCIARMAQATDKPKPPQSIFEHSLEEMFIDGPNATSMDPVPEGEYEALVEDYSIGSVTTKRGETPIMDVTWIIPDEGLQKKLNRETVTARQSIRIDLNGDGSIGTGPNQNVGLGRLRTALGLNGRIFYFSQLRGAGPARVLVIHCVDKRPV